MSNLQTHGDTYWTTTSTFYSWSEAPEACTEMGLRLARVDDQTPYGQLLATNFGRQTEKKTNVYEQLAHHVLVFQTEFT